MTDKIGRRGFLGTAAPAALAVPLLSQAGRANSLGSSASLQGGAKATIKRIAVEEHWTAEDVSKALKRAVRRPDEADLGEIRLSAMDAAGITMQVISNGYYADITDVPTAVALVKKNNDRLAEAIRKHPDRFAGFAGLALQDPKSVADELERAVTQLGLKGAMVHGQDHANWEYLDSQKFWPLWERAAALGVPICLHPLAPPPDSFKMIEGRPELQSLDWAGAVYVATQALRLMVSGVFDAFPKATLILGHLGELLPYWLGRLDESTKMKKRPSAYMRENVLLTTSGSYRPEALVCAIAAMGADRVLFATDYPNVDGKLCVQMVENTPMSGADREKIYHLNAERWLRL